MRAPAREWQRLGCAAALGAIVAFPAGVLFSGREAVRSEAPGAETASGRPMRGTAARKPYSPYVLSDPYVLQQHREIVEALEMACRDSGENCAEAERARRYLAEREASRAR